LTHLPNRDIFQNEEAVEMAVHGYPLTQEPVHSRDGILKNPYQKKKTGQEEQYSRTLFFEI
jgi:hypothetical protein